MARGSGFSLGRVSFWGSPISCTKVTQDDLYEDRTIYCSEAGGSLTLLRLVTEWNGVD